MTMEKLPEDFKAKWVSALRSGEYEQGMDYLYSSKLDSYCCLGVACKVAGENPGLFSYIPAEYRLVPQILIPHSNSDYPARVLSKMNDSGNYTFSEIADYIEANL